MTCESCGGIFNDTDREYDGWHWCGSCRASFCQYCVEEKLLFLRGECDGTCIRSPEDMGARKEGAGKKAKVECDCHENVKKLRSERNEDERWICSDCLLDYKVVDAEVLLAWLLKNKKCGYEGMKELCDAYNSAPSDDEE